MTTKVEAELVGHSKTGLWLRVVDGEAFKVLTYSHEGIRLAQRHEKGTMLLVEVTDPEVIAGDEMGWKFKGEILKVEVS